MPFTKGHQQWDHPNSIATQFKKGQTPHNLGSPICIDCGLTKTTKNTLKDTNTKSGLRARCKDCNRRWHRLYYSKHIEAQRAASRKTGPNKYRTPKGIMKTYRRAAKERGLCFTLELTLFEKYWQSDCYYCGQKIKLVGFDRINNTIGYISTNVVPCCALCNWMKKDLSQSEFITHCKRIINTPQEAGCD